MQSFDEGLKQALSHVLWLGGSVCAGKSTIANLLGDKHSWRVYHFDQHEREHIARGSYSPSISATVDDLWLRRSIDLMVEQTITAWSSRFRLVVEDLLAMPRDSPILAEG